MCSLCNAHEDKKDGILLELAIQEVLTYPKTGAGNSMHS